MSVRAGTLLRLGNCITSVEKQSRADTPVQAHAGIINVGPKNANKTHATATNSVAGLPNAWMLLNTLETMYSLYYVKLHLVVFKGRQRPEHCPSGTYDADYKSTQSSHRP